MNENNIEDSSALCSYECDHLKKTTTTAACLNCDCKNLYDCSYRGHTVYTCSFPLKYENRRYRHVNFYDTDQECDYDDRDMLMSFRRFIHWCDFCWCYCDDPTPKSHRIISLQKVEANTSANEVVTGVRVIKYEKVFYLQIQVGRMIPYHKIDQGSLRWVPIQPIKSVSYEMETSEYFILRRRMRFDMDIVQGKENQVLTG